MRSPSIKTALTGIPAAQIDILKSLDNDMASLIWGVSAGLVSSFFVALYPLLLKRSMVSLDNWQISIHVNLMSLLWFALPPLK